MNKKTNGTGNGHDKNGHDKDAEQDKVIRFPTLAQRDRARREQAAQEAQWRKDYKAQQTPKQRSNGDNPPFINLEKITPFIRVLALLFLLVHLPLYLFMDATQRFAIFNDFGFTPASFTGLFTGDYNGAGGFDLIALLSIITHLFVHGSWMHLVFNMVMTLAMGIFFERAHGTRAAIFLFFACGLAGALTHFIFNPFANGPLIGASGGLSGFFGAAILMLHEQKSMLGSQLGNVRIKMGTPGGRGFMQPPWPMIGFWVIFMITLGLLGGGGVAWQAHLGGFIAGVALFRGMQKGIIQF